MNMLGIFANELKNIGVPYEFMEWTSPVQYPYFVGEYTETVPTTEDGYESGSLILTGTTKGSWLELEQIKEKVKNHFPPIYGLRKSTDVGTVVFYYANSVHGHTCGGSSENSITSSVRG
jgi:hypothetical protein